MLNSSHVQWVFFSYFVVIWWFFFKKFFPEHYQSVKQSWSESKLFEKQTTKVAASKEGVKILVRNSSKFVPGSYIKDPHFIILISDWKYSADVMSTSSLCVFMFIRKTIENIDLLQ